MANATERLAELDAERDFLAACVKVQKPFDDAKQAYREALASGDQAAIDKTQKAKNKAALKLREFREWARLAAADQEAADGEIRTGSAKAVGRVPEAGGR